MALYNSKEEYGWVSKAFHWIMAALFLAMFLSGLLMGEMKNSPLKLQIYALHKSTGILILLLAFQRLCWKITQIAPELPAHMTSFQRLLAHGTHWMLYLFLFIIPISGWLMSNAAGYNVWFYGLFPLPSLIQPDRDLRKFFAESHEIMAYTAIWLMTLHVAAALWHHFAVRDQLLLRMLPQKRRSK